MRAKLGAVLLREGHVSPEQLEEALRLQVIYGGKLGTNLVELGYIDEDALTDVLAQVSGCPRATEQMFEDTSPDALAIISPELAEKHECFPLRKEGRRLLLAMVNPSDLAATDEISFLTGLRVVPHVCAEIRLQFHLERAYGVQRKMRYIRLSPREQASLRGTSSMGAMLAGPGRPIGAPAPSGARAPVMPPQVGVRVASTPPPPRPSAPAPVRTPAPVARPPSVPPALPSSAAVASSAPPPVRTPTVPPVPSAERASTPPPVVRGPVRTAPVSTPPVVRPPSVPSPPRVAAQPQAPAAVPAPPAAAREATPPPPPAVLAPLSADQAVERLARAGSRGDIAEIVLRHAMSGLDAAGLLLVQEGRVLGWKGAGARLSEAAPKLLVPLDQPSMFRNAVMTGRPYAGDVAAVEAHGRFFETVGAPPPGWCVLVPVVMRNRTVNLIYGERVDGTPSPVANSLAALAPHVVAAYERLVLEARRRAEAGKA